ncbi:MAG: exonuclease SbcCD subunit D [Dehalococcoidia bacterium]|nr:exonuclease SbcCD subunit D [Dehalococcoidia bacterium]
MRILHFADLHLGIEKYSRPDPETGMPSRVIDFLKALDELVDYALSARVDLVLFCGDAYRNREPSQTYQREFAKRIVRLAAGGVPVFLLVGNHDLPSAVYRATTVEIFDTVLMDRVTVAAKPGVYLVQTKSGPIQIVAMPWPRRSSLLGKEGYKNLSLVKADHVLAEAIAQEINDQAEKLDPGLPAILAAHVSFAEAKGGSEQRMVMGQDPLLLLSSIPREAFDYGALGHCHTAQAISLHPPMIYPGSLQPVDFGEADQPNGFYVVEIDPARPRGERAISHEFKPVTSRPFVTIKVDANSDEPTTTVLQAISKKSISRAIVRLLIQVDSERDARLREADIREALATAQVFTISREVKRERRTRLGGYSAEAITPAQALRVYLESLKDLPPDRARTLLEYGERLLAEEREEAEQGADTAPK